MKLRVAKKVQCREIEENADYRHDTSLRAEKRIARWFAQQRRMRDRREACEKLLERIFGVPSC